jgi:hypothetical protein
MPRVAGLLLAAASIASSGSARGDSTSSQRQLARDLMKRGNELRAANDPEGALDAFRSADSIMHAPTTGFEVARSEVKLGKLVEASDTLARILQIPPAPDEPQAFKNAREYARLLELEVEPRIPKIRLRIEATVDARGTRDVSVSIDGESIPIAAFDIPYAIDPGQHAIVASWTDGRTAKLDVEVHEGEDREVALPLPAEPIVPLRPPPAVPLRETPVAKPDRAPSDGRTLAWIAFGTAGAAAVVGGGTGIASWVRASSASARCHGTQCPPSTYADIDAAHTLATVSTVSFIVAGTAAAVGVVALLSAPGASVKKRAQRPGETTVRIAPWVGLGSAGVAGSFF